MKKFLENNFKYLFYFFLFVLPWQTRLFLYQGQIKGAYSEFISVSLYVSDIILVTLIMAAAIIFFADSKKFIKPNLKISKLWWFLAGLDAVFLISAFLSSDYRSAFYRYALFLFGAALFFIISQARHFRLKKITAIYVFLSSLFLHACLGIYQFLMQSTFACKYLGLAQHLPYALSGESVLENVSGRWLRAYGGFDHPNIFGAMMAVGVILTVYLLINKTSNKKWLNLNLSFLFIFTLALFFSFSRGSWLALAAAFVTWILVEYQKPIFSYKLEFFRRPLFWGALLLLVIFLFQYSNLVTTRIGGKDRLEIKSVAERINYVIDAKNLLHDRWLFGVGPGNYVAAVTEINPHQPFWYYQPVHNYFLLAWAELGIFGLLFFLCFFGTLIFSLSISRRGHGLNLALAAILIMVMMLEHWLFSLHFGILITWLLLGLISWAPDQAAQTRQVRNDLKK